MGAHLLVVGGDDHHLRIPFMNALRARGHRVTAAACADPAPFRRAGLEFISFTFNRFWDPVSDWRARRALAALLAEVDADLAHCFDTKLSLLVPFARAGSPRTAIVRTINGRGQIFSSRSPSALALRAAYLPLQRLAARSTAATVFEHRGDQAFFERYRLIGGTESIIIAGAGIDVGGFEAARRRGPDPARLRKELGLEGAEVVMTVTRVTRQKGVPDLLAAAALVHRERPGVKFVIVGPREGEGAAAVPDRDLAPHADYVLATGPRPDVPSLLAMADVFAFPSAYAEGVPRALMEAALCGLPIVATSLPGCREVIRDEWNGYLTPPRDPRAFARRILHVLDHRQEAARVGARGPAIIRRAFSLDVVVAQHAELYERVLARRAGTRRPSPAGAEGRLEPAKAEAVGSGRPGREDLHGAAG